MVFEARKGMHAQFYRTSEVYRLERKQQADRQAFASGGKRVVLRIRRQQSAHLPEAAADVGNWRYLLYYRASFAPADSRNPDENKCRIRMA
jgi:hypothetical protein